MPSPRVGHASALVSSVLIVWGGDTKSDTRPGLSDTQDDGLYLLNLGKLHLFVHLDRVSCFFFHYSFQSNHDVDPLTNY